MIAQRFLSIAALIVACSLPALSQTATAELSGNVTDSTGAIVANAKVTVANPQTGLTRETRSNATGAYNFTILPPGAYNLTVEAPGFRKTVQNNIELQVNQRAEINVQMQLGQISETVEVSGTAPL